MLSSEETPRSVLKVLVADSNAMTARLLAADLRRENQFDALECALIPGDILGCIERENPAVLLLALSYESTVAEPAARTVMQESLDLIRTIRTSHTSTQMVALVDRVDRQVVCEVFRAGARGVFERASYDLPHISRCVECVAQGQVWARSQLLGFVLEAFEATTPIRLTDVFGRKLLTPRETDVTRLVADGFSNRDVAQRLGLSAHTVRNYLFNIFEKLGVSSRAELILYVLSQPAKSVSEVKSLQRSVEPIPGSYQARVYV
jgi:DNA-binding NarL/FixJ family response regulator